MTMARGSGAVFTSSMRRRPTAWRIAGSPSFAEPDFARVPNSREDRPMTGRLLRGLLLLSLACCALGAAAPVKSKPETALHRIQRTVALIDAQAKTPEGETQVVARLSAQLGV